MSELLPPARPPTPPPSRSKEASARSIVATVLQRPTILGTPPASTPPSNEASSEINSSDSSGSRKRVGFSLENHQLSVAHLQSPNKLPLKTVPPSRESKATKSILKPSIQPLEPNTSDAEPTKSSQDFLTMLDSLFVQLSNGNRSTSIDAYANLCGMVRVTEQAPETYLKDKMGHLLKHIRRDLRKDASAPRTEAMNLTTHAIKVLIILLWNPKLCLSFTDEYRSFLLDCIAEAIEDKETPKAVVLHYLRLLQTQDFRPNVMTPTRAARILDALYNLTNNIKGNGVVSERLEVYSHLIDQCKGAMKAKVAWVEQLLAGMLMPSKDTRSKAISVGIKTVQTFGSSSTISAACQKALASQIVKSSDPAMSFSLIACKRLRQMVKTSEDSFQVPQIWGIVILLLKGNYPKIQKWTDFKDWLMVIQACFNCSDSATRAQANLAWNRLVYVVTLHDNTDPSIVKMLIKPITTQLERSGSDRQGKGSRSWAASTFYVLLYYGFRPSSSFKQLDLFWNAFILEVFTEKYLQNSVNADNACRVLTNLLCSSRGKIWRDTRAIEMPRMEPEELPVLDCRWIRSRSVKVLVVFRRLFKTASWGVGDPEQAFVGSAWKHFSQAIGDACRKEIKVSSETVQTIAHLIVFLQSIWATGPEALHLASIEGNLFLKRFTFLVQSLLAEIGPIPFSEPLFGLDEYTRLTPLSSSLTSNKNQGISALETLLKTVSDPPCGVLPDGLYSQFIGDVLEIALDARSSVGAQIAFYRNCSNLPLRQDSVPATRVHSVFWRSSASLVSKILSERHSDFLRSGETSSSSQDLIIEDVRSVMKSVGSSFEVESQQAWAELLQNSLSLVENTRGQRSWSSFILEPLAQHLLSVDCESSPLLAVKLLETTVSPRIWGCLQPMLKKPRTQSGKSISLEHFTTLASNQLRWCYKVNISQYRDGFEMSVEYCKRLIDSSSTEFLSLILQNLAPSICLWLEDGDKAFVWSTEEGKLRSEAACKLCPTFMRMAKRLLDESVPLSVLEGIILAGLRSTHLVTVNWTIDILKSLSEKNLKEASSSLQEAIARLGVDVDLPLPKAINHNSDESLPLMHIMDSQYDGVRSRERPSIVPHFAPQSPKKHKQKSVVESRRPSPAIQPQLTTMVKPYLRRDDSQIQYKPVDSSPFVEDELESQCLTNRQKEVRERQRVEPATTFSDLVSSPAAIRAEKRPGKLTLSRTDGFPDKRISLIEEPSTPTLPEATNDFEEHVSSSPTPSSKSQQLHFSEIDVPSSPPSLASAEIRDTATGSQRVHEEACLISSAGFDRCETALREPEKEQSVLSAPGILLAMEGNIDISCTHEVEESNLCNEDPSLASGDKLMGKGQTPPLSPYGPALTEPENGLYPATSTMLTDETNSAANALELPPINKVEGLRTSNVTNAAAENNQSDRVEDAATPEAIQTPPAPLKDGLQSHVDRDTLELSSDEIDDLTASQLEHELQYTTTEDVAVASTPSPSLENDYEIRSSEVSHSGGLLSQNHKEESRNERLSQESTSSLQDHSNSMPELLDTITVDMSAYKPLRPISNSQPSTTLTAQTTKRSRGRPRGTKRKSASITPDDVRSQTSIEVRISPRKRPKTKNSTTSRRSPRFNEVKEEQVDNEDDGEVRSYRGPPADLRSRVHGESEIGSVTDIGDPNLEEHALQVPQESSHLSPIPCQQDVGSITPDLIKNDLCGILTGLRNCKLSLTELREIDDLVFNIRMEAQNAVKRKG